MSARDWDSFKEKLEHEIESCSVSLEVDGYRVDEKRGKPKGIRDHCCPTTEENPTPKSCDYFYLYENKFFCIEFSDLMRQYENENKTYQGLKAKQENKAERKMLKRTQPESILLDEYRNKICDTDYLLRIMYTSSPQLINNLPKESLPKYFFVVWHIKDGLSDIDVARFSSLLEDKLKNKLINEFKRRCSTHLPLTNDSIYFLTVDMFKERYISENIP